MSATALHAAYGTLTTTDAVPAPGVTWDELNGCDDFTCPKCGKPMVFRIDPTGRRNPHFRHVVGSAANCARDYDQKRARQAYLDETTGMTGAERAAAIAAMKVGAVGTYRAEAATTDVDQAAQPVGDLTTAEVRLLHDSAKSLEVAAWVPKRVDAPYMGFDDPGDVRAEDKPKATEEAAREARNRLRGALALYAEVDLATGGPWWQDGGTLADGAQ